MIQNIRVYGQPSLGMATSTKKGLAWVLAAALGGALAGRVIKRKINGLRPW